MIEAHKPNPILYRKPRKARVQGVQRVQEFTEYISSLSQSRKEGKAFRITLQEFTLEAHNILPCLLENGLMDEQVGRSN